MYVLGKQEGCYFAEEVLQTYRPDESVEYAHDSYHIEEALPALMAAPRDTILLDVGAYHDEYRVMGTAVRKMLLANPKAMFIVFAEGHSRNTSLVQELIEVGARYFVFGVTLGDQRKKLGEIFAGRAEPLLPQEQAPEDIENDAIAEQELTASKEGKIKIAIAGSSPRIGTTTHAFQIVRFLLLQGKRVCYIEKNNSQFAIQLYDYYDEEEISNADAALGMYRCSSVDIFYKQEMIIRALALDYQYYVFDYGCVHDPSFDVMSFLERDQKILVCGYKANENVDLQRVLTQNILIENDSLQYLFNFVAKSDVADLTQMMDSKADKSTFYTYYTPDNLVYDDPDGGKDAMYRRLLDYSGESAKPPEKKKFGLFGKRR